MADQIEIKHVETPQGEITTYGPMPNGVHLSSSGHVLWGWWNINMDVNRLYTGNS